MRPFRLLALFVLLLGPTGARSDEIGPAQAQALQQQLRDWITGLLGPSVKLPEPLPWQVSADHDHYVITWPVPGLTTPSGEPSVTAKIRPLDGNRWSVDALTVPPAGSFTMMLDAPPVKGEFSIGRQSTTGVIDPGFASESKLQSELSDFSMKTEGERQKQEQRFGHYLSDTRLVPRGDGRLDLTNKGQVEGWNSAMQIDNGSPVAVSAQTIRSAAQVSGISRDRVASLLAATGGMIGASPPGFGAEGRSPGLPPAIRAQLHLAVESLQDMLSSIRLEETLDGVRVEMAGVGSLSIKHAAMGVGGESAEGRLRAWIDLAFNDLASPSLPPNVAEYLPHHLQIKPTFSGALTTDLQRLALDATDEAAVDDRFAADLSAMFSHGPIEVGLQTLSFDLGAAKVDGSGAISVTSPSIWQGKAHLEATGLDELTAQARTRPELQSALPTLIMLRGLAKQDGERLVWDIATDGRSTTVNGFDLSQLGGDTSKNRPPLARKPGQPSSR